MINKFTRFAMKLDQELLRRKKVRKGNQRAKIDGAASVFRYVPHISL